MLTEVQPSRGIRDGRKAKALLRSRTTAASVLNFLTTAHRVGPIQPYKPGVSGLPPAHAAARR